MTLKKQEPGLGCRECVCLFLAIAAPTALLILALSDVPYCFGVVVINTVSEHSCNFIGDIVIACSLVGLCLYYVLDITAWKRGKAAALMLPWAMFMVGAFLKARRYPATLMVMIIFHEVLLLFLLRRKLFLELNRTAFYSTVAVFSALVAAAALAAMVVFVISGNYWHESAETEVRFAKRLDIVYKSVGEYNLGVPLDYTAHCGIGGKPTALDEFEGRAEVVAKYEAACASAHRVLVWVWVCPLVAFFGNLTVCLFATSQALVVVVNMTSKEIILKQFLGVISVIVGGLYVAAVMNNLSEDVMSALGMCCFLGLAAVMAWAYWELDITVIVKEYQQSKLMDIMTSAVESDWVKAMAVGSGFVPAFLALESCRQRCNKKQGLLPASDPMADLYDHMVCWNWTNILLNVCILGEVFFTLQVGFSKLTSIFLSWMNVQLAGMDFVQLNLVMFGVGFVMFLCPAVPGNAVYLFVGLVDGVQASGGDAYSMGFLKGIATAICVCSFTKLVACVGQYGIGYCMSRSTKIRQMVGVTSVQVRAMEELLKAPGMGLGKVAVLVCGPDWPVSVLCGIFRLNIPRMLLGTLPVILVSIVPTAVAGACQGVAKSGEGDFLQAAAASGILLCGLLTAAGMLIMMNKVTAVISEKGAQLAVPRPEDAEVEELNEQQAEYVKLHQQKTAWGELRRWDKFVLVSAAVLMLLHGLIIVGAGSKCFQKFEVSGKMTDHKDNFGLGCEQATLLCGLTNIIVRPGGFIVLTVFALAVFLHVVFVLTTNRRVRRELLLGEDDQESSSTVASSHPS